MKDILISKDSKFPSPSLVRKIIISDDSGRQIAMGNVGKRKIPAGMGSSRDFWEFSPLFFFFLGKSELKKVPSHFYPSLTLERGKTRLRLCRGEAANPKSRFFQRVFSLFSIAPEKIPGKSSRLWQQFPAGGAAPCGSAPFILISSISIFFLSHFPAF